jgi:hypothetical protein
VKKLLGGLKYYAIEWIAHAWRRLTVVDPRKTHLCFFSTRPLPLEAIPKILPEII